MATVIAARFQSMEQAGLAVDQLMQAGFSKGKITSFYVNPPGQHATYPIGGDRYESPGTVLDEDSTSGSVTKAVVEAVIGVDPSNETHVNGHSTHEALHAREEHTMAAGSPAHVGDIVPLRKSGMLVAAELGGSNLQDKTVALLIALGAKDLEKLNGNIINGEWGDFDPLSEPSYI